MASPPPARPLRRVEDLHDVRRPSSGVLINTFAVVFVTALVAFLAWLLTLVPALLPWLHWPVIVTLAGTVIFALWVAVFTLRSGARSQDTPTSTIRGAAQGEVELRGRVHAIPGRELVSTLMNVACITYSGKVLGLKADETDDTLQKVSGRCSFLLRDGTGEVFVPACFFDEGLSLTATEMMGKPPPSLGRLTTSQYDGFKLCETLVPIDIDVQVNGVFATLGADESYVDLVTQRSVGTIDPTIDTDWRAYADAALAANPAHMPPPRLNVVLPDADRLGVVVSDSANDQSSQAGTAATLVLLAILPALAMLSMLGLVEVGELLRRAIGMITALMP